VGAVNDVSALAAIEAFQEFARGDCVVVGQDAVLESRQEMRRRSRLIGSVAFFPETWRKADPARIDMAENRDHPPAIFTAIQLVSPQTSTRFIPTIC
jgi:ABC-type sugar transport system substrate-binding protein